MVLVGLTGGIGSGKSTVSALLAERGALVVDADAIVREVQAPGTPVLEAIVERFGPEVLAADGTLARQALADVVFGDDDALAALNALVHPAVGAEIARRLEAAAGTDRVVVLDVPLLVESGRDDTGAEPPGEATQQARWSSSEAQPRKSPPVSTPYSRDPLAELVVVDLDPEVAVARAVEHRGMRADDVRARIARQATREQRLARATIVIDNSGGRDELEARVAEVWERLDALRT